MKYPKKLSLSKSRMKRIQQFRCYHIGLTGPATTDCTTSSNGKTNWYLTSRSYRYGFDTVQIFVDGGSGSTVSTPNDVLDPGEKNILATQRWNQPVK